MPIPTHINIQALVPQSWIEFEDMARDALAVKWNSPNLSKNGRSGQEQNGVDIYGKDHENRFVGVQCKNTLSGSIALSTIKAEIEKAEYFKPSLQVLYIATSAPADTHVQREVRLLSDQRKQKQKFAVEILFWEDIHRELVKDSRLSALYFPFLGKKDGVADTSTQGLLGILDLAYYGLCLKFYIDHLFGWIGQAVEDPVQIATLGRIIQNAARRVMQPEEYAEVSKHLERLVSYCFSMVREDSEKERSWQPLEDDTALIENEIRNLEYRLKGQEQAAHMAGRLFSLWLIQSDDDIAITPKFEGDLILSLDHLPIEQQDRDTVKHCLDEYREFITRSTVQVAPHPHKAYNTVRAALIRHALKNS